MKLYIDHLRAERERARNESKEAIRAAERKRLRDSRIQCDTPLTEQIEALMRSLPRAQRTARGQWRNSWRGCMAGTTPASALAALVSR